VHGEPPVYDPSKRGIAPSQVADKRQLAIGQLGDSRQSTGRGDFSSIDINLIDLEVADTRQIDRQSVAPSSIGERFAHIGIEGAVARKEAAVRAAMHGKYHYEPRPVSQPWLPTKHF